MGITVTVSPKYQVVIPKEIRTALKIKPGQKLLVSSSDFSIQLMPKDSLKKMRGFLSGYDLPPFEREKNRKP
jgi:AbrB family looped-hinge helix DNA binding protein